MIDPATARVPQAVARGITLGAAPAVIYLAHMVYGAALDLPALVLFAVLSVLLSVSLTRPTVREALSRMTPALPLAILFGLVILVALWTLTPLVPGGSHPIWAWAGLPPAGTLSRSATILETIKLLGLASVFVLGCALGATAERARAVLWLILCLGAVYGLVCLVIYLGEGTSLSRASRFTAGFKSPNVAGTQFGALFLLAVAWTVRAWRQARRQSPTDRIVALAPAAAMILIFLACLLVTASRGAIAATALALVLFLTWEAVDDRRPRWPLIAVGFGLILVVAVLLVSRGNSLFIDRFGMLEGAADLRGQVFEAHWRAFLSSPLFGSGLGTFSQTNNQIMTAGNADALSASVVLHNVYLQWLGEAGLVGALPMFATVALILGAIGWRAVTRPRNRTFLAAVTAVSILVLAHAAVDVSLNTPSFEAFWTLLLGWAFALGQAPSGRR